MSVVERLRDTLVGNTYVLGELDNIMEENKYYPVETESEDDVDTGILKYTNQKSQIWLYYISDGIEYVVENVTLRTKKRGNTTTSAIRDWKELKQFMDYFRNKELYDEFLVFMLELLLARRIGDTLSLKWSDFYHENGKKKHKLRTLVEEKTDKVCDITITDDVWKFIDYYSNKTGVNPLHPMHNDIFWSKDKENAQTPSEYAKAIDKMAARFRASLKKASKSIGVENISTHSLRKTFGYYAHLIHQYDPDCIQCLQSIYGHVTTEYTKVYIDVMAEKAERIFYDVAKYVQDIDNNVNPNTKSMPIIVTKTNELQDLLLMAYNMGRENSDKDTSENLNTMNFLYTELERLRIK